MSAEAATLKPLKTAVALIFYSYVGKQMPHKCIEQEALRRCDRSLALTVNSSAFESTAAIETSREVTEEHEFQLGTYRQDRFACQVGRQSSSLRCQRYCHKIQSADHHDNSKRHELLSQQANADGSAGQPCEALVGPERKRSCSGTTQENASRSVWRNLCVGDR